MGIKSKTAVTGFLKVGQIIEKSVFEGKNVVKVRCQSQKLHKRFKVYLPNPYDKLCLYPNIDCNIGDIVVIKPISYKETGMRATPGLESQVSRHFFKLGETYCPVTGARCRGTNFIPKKYLNLDEGEEDTELEDRKFDSINFNSLEEAR